MDIYNFFSKFRIYNCILVSQVHYVIDNGYNRPTKGNDVETGVQLRVNTWLLKKELKVSGFSSDA